MTALDRTLEFYKDDDYGFTSKVLFDDLQAAVIGMFIIYRFAEYESSHTHALAHRL
jgi:hypothetical protein